MTNSNSNGLKWVLSLVGAGFLLSVAVSWALLSQHSDVTHEDSVPWKVYQKDVGEIHQDIREIRDILRDRDKEGK